MTITYSGKSKYSAVLIMEELANMGIDCLLNRGADGDINFGRYKANTDLNPDISNVTNKRVMRELFAEHDVPMPKLIDFDRLEKTAGNFPIPCVGRPDKHMKGRGFWLINSWEDVLKARKGTKRKKAATHFMEYVEAPHEYRVHIFKGKSIRISEKEFFINEDGKKDYTTIKPKDKVRHVRRAAKCAMEAVGLDFGAVDILATDSECWVLEVNAAPGLGGTMPELYAKVFKEYMNGEW